jgi:hypothetical protein
VSPLFGSAADPMRPPTTITLQQPMLRDRLDTALDLDDASLPIQIAQVLNLNVTVELHENFLHLFCVGSDARAASVTWWTSGDEITKCIRLAEWWATVRHAKTRDRWTAKAESLGLVTAPIIAKITDWNRLIFFILVALDCTWSVAVSSDDVTPPARDICRNLDISEEGFRTSPFASPQ